MIPDVALPPDERLRAYQQDAVHAVHAHLADTARAVLGVAATGTGKSVIIAALARSLNQRVLLIAHRDELLEQLAATVREWWPGVTVGIVKGSRLRGGRRRPSSRRCRRSVGRSASPRS